ncbi:MAG: hypothetical protein GXY48_02495 [Methanomicrobiales archaeon]|nr:hypothetical protein [Methanomicrobiales archaeon]
MATISSLIASRRVEDKLRAVTVLTQHRSILPDAFSDRIIDELNKNNHAEIQDALKPLLKTDVENPEASLVSHADIVAGYSGSLENALKKVINIANVFDLSQVTAKALRQQFSEGRDGTDNGLYSDFIQQKTNIEPDLLKLPQISLFVSPISALTEVIRIMPELSRKNKIDENNLKKKNLIAKIDEIIETEQEISFNIAGYELLYTLERLIRDLIHERIIKPNYDNLQTKIPQDVLEGMKKRKNIEENNPIADGNYELIEYCDFTDLKKILEKGRNHESFSDIFSYEEIKTVHSKLGELDPIRKKIAHSRPLTRKEFERLRLYASDILERLK